jgi:carbonic anhydrase
MSKIDSLLQRNASFAASDVRHNTPRLPFLPHQGLYVITCIDPRTDPAEFLGLEFSEAIVARSVGGRVTPAVIQDVAYIGYLVESKAPEGPYFEVAIIHHSDCGSRLLEDDQLRHGFAQRTGYDEQMLADLPATDPAITVRVDSERLLTAPQISRRITVSGHVYDVESGLVTTVVSPASPPSSDHRSGAAAA